MQARHIVTQDRDEIYPVDEMTFIYTMSVTHKGQYMGCNLFTLEGLIGTFDTEELADKELYNLQNSVDEIYITSGYCPG